jgi:hypothetical protein
VSHKLAKHRSDLDKMSSILSGQLSCYIRTALPDSQNLNVDVQPMSDFVTFLAVFTSQQKKK